MTTSLWMQSESTKAPKRREGKIRGFVFIAALGLQLPVVYSVWVNWPAGQVIFDPSMYP